MGNPSSVAPRRRSPQRRKQFNERMVKGVFCFVLVVAFAALATSLPYRPGPQNGCAAPWTQLSTGCYRFLESQMTQSEAKKFCEEEQGVPAHLLEMDSDEEERAIIAEMQRRNSFSQKISWLGICQKNCAAPWTQLSTGCYRFHESPMTQIEAKKFCEEEQGVPAHLVEIDSAEENRASLPRCRGETLIRGKLTSGLASTTVTLRDIGFSNQLANVSFSPTGNLGSQTMLEDLEARTVPLSMNWTSGVMSIATANQTMGGREQLFVRKVNQ